MDAQDPEQRIAELERQLAEARAAAGHDGGQDGEEHARRYAQSVWEGLRTGGPAGPDGPDASEMAAHREAFQRAATEAGLSRAQIDDIFARGKPTINIRRSVVYSKPDRAAGWRQNSVAAERPSVNRGGANRVGKIIGKIVAAVGICWGGSAVLTLLFPSSVLWMSPLVCRSPYELTSNALTYSNRPGQTRTSITYRCVSADAWYYANTFVMDVLQAIAFGLVLLAVLLVIEQIRKGMGKTGA